MNLNHRISAQQTFRFVKWPLWLFNSAFHLQPAGILCGFRMFLHADKPVLDQNNVEHHRIGCSSLILETVYSYACFHDSSSVTLLDCSILVGCKLLLQAEFKCLPSLVQDWWDHTRVPEWPAAESAVLHRIWFSTYSSSGKLGQSVCLFTCFYYILGTFPGRSTDQVGTKYVN